MADVGGRAHEQENVVGVRLNQCWLKIERDEKFKGYIPTSIFVEFILSIFLLYAAYRYQSIGSSIVLRLDMK